MACLSVLHIYCTYQCPSSVVIDMKLNNLATWLVYADVQKTDMKGKRRRASKNHSFIWTYQSIRNKKKKKKKNKLYKAFNWLLLCML